MTASNERKPSLYWRGVIRDGMYRAPSDDAELLAFCARVHSEEKTIPRRGLGRSDPSAVTAP